MARTESHLEKFLSAEAEAHTVFFPQFNFIKFEGLYQPPAQQVMETLLRRLIKALQVSDAKFQFFIGIQITGSLLRKKNNRRRCSVKALDKLRVIGLKCLLLKVY